MEPSTQPSQFHGWERLVGRWSTEATHPGLPGTVVDGEVVFEWLEDQRFLIQRSRYDHPEIPDAIAVIGLIDGAPTMHYFDPRGVHRVFAVEVDANTWRFSNNVPGFSQRFVYTISGDGDGIAGQGELSLDDGGTWEDDMTITFRRIG